MHKYYKVRGISGIFAYQMENGDRIVTDDYLRLLSALKDTIIIENYDDETDSCTLKEFKKTIKNGPQLKSKRKVIRGSTVNS